MLKESAPKAWAAIVVMLFIAPAFAADGINPYGKPEVKNFEGYKIWRGEKIWRIEMVAGDAELDFTGEISCEGAGRIKGVYLLDNGEQKPYGNWNDRLIKISSTVKSATKNLTFDITCDRLKFDLMINGERKPQLIVIGEGRKRPEKIPFALEAK